MLLLISIANNNKLRNLKIFLWKQTLSVLPQKDFQIL